MGQAPPSSQPPPVGFLQIFVGEESGAPGAAGLRLLLLLLPCHLGSRHRRIGPPDGGQRQGIEPEEAILLAATAA